MTTTLANQLPRINLAENESMQSAEVMTPKFKAKEPPPRLTQIPKPLSENLTASDTRLVAATITCGGRGYSGIGYAYFGGLGVGWRGTRYDG